MAHSTKESQVDRGLFALLKGESGAGKSVAALSFPGVYVFDMDNKMPAIARKHFPDRDIHWDTFKDLWGFVDQVDSWVNDTETCPYETLVVDSLTGLITDCLKAISVTKNDRVIEVLRTPNKKGNLDLRDWDYYNGEARFVEEFLIPRLRSLWLKPGYPRHVLLTAHVIPRENAKGTIRSIVTAGTKAAAYIPSQFDEMFYFATQNPDVFGDDAAQVKRVCRTMSFSEDSAKTAHNFPAEIDFTNKSLFKEFQSVANFTVDDQSAL